MVPFAWLKPYYKQTVVLEVLHTSQSFPNSLGDFCRKGGGVTFLYDFSISRNAHEALLQAHLKKQPAAVNHVPMWPKIMVMQMEVGTVGSAPLPSPGKSPMQLQGTDPAPPSGAPLQREGQRVLCWGTADDDTPSPSPGVLPPLSKTRTASAQPR